MFLDCNISQWRNVAFSEIITSLIHSISFDGGKRRDTILEQEMESNVKMAFKSVKY